MKVLSLRLLVLDLAWCSTGCSINRMVVNKVGNALSGSGTTFSADDDPSW